MAAGASSGVGMAKADRSEKRPRLNLEAVYRQTWPLIGRHAIALLLIAAGIGWLVEAAMAHAPLPRLSVRSWDWIAWLVRLAMTSVSMIVNVLLNMCAANTVLASARNPIVSLAETARVASSRLGGAVVVAVVLNGSSLLSSLVLLRFSPLFPPATILNWQVWVTTTSGLATMVWAIWALSWVGLASVVLVEEQVSGIGALRRASFLARGQRWRLMGVYLPLNIVFGVLIAVVSFMSATHRASIMALFMREGSGIALLEALSATVTGALTAVAYRDLSKMKDGDRPSEVAAIFD